MRFETTSVGNRKEHEREYAASGQPVRESRWIEGRLSEETLWYLNGNLKSKKRWQRDGAQVLVTAEEYWDTGGFSRAPCTMSASGMSVCNRGSMKTACWLAK